MSTSNDTIHELTESEKDTPLTEPKTQTDSPLNTQILDNVLSSLFKGLGSIEQNVNNEEETSNTEYTDLDLYLLDDKGNNLCDHIQNIDTTLNKINNSIQELISVYKIKHEQT